MQLNIFEPRYRLLVRRCMEGNRRFGMATVNQLGELSPVACQGEILECMPLPDGSAFTSPFCLLSCTPIKPGRAGRKSRVPRAAHICKREIARAAQF